MRAIPGLLESELFAMKRRVHRHRAKIGRLELATRHALLDEVGDCADLQPKLLRALQTGDRAAGGRDHSGKCA